MELPRAWIVHRAVELRANSTREQLQLDPARISEILFPEIDGGRDPARMAHDPRSVVWLESGRRAELERCLDGHPPTPTEEVHFVKYEPDRAELKATLDRPGLVVFSDVYYPGWTLTIDGRPAQIERANRMMRAAAVAQREHTLVFTYHPTSFRVGLVVSGLSLAALIPVTLLASHAPYRGPVSRRGHMKVEANSLY